VILEIRTYRLRPGTAFSFHIAMTQRGVPLLEAAGIDAVYCGPSAETEDGVPHYVLMRAFASVEERARVERDFYASDAWRLGPQREILAAIDSYHTVVLEDAARLIDAARALPRPQIFPDSA